MTHARHCHACGRDNESDARFCSGCGAPLTGEARHREARKVVTALFADVVGSTALGERLDPEDLQAIVGDGVARIVRAAEGLGGHVDRVVGDGALIIFGAPAAHEDDPERAVLAGLRIVDAIEAYAGEVSERWGVQGFAVRVGVETGPAVLAPVGESPIEFGAMGDVLNTAARLEAAARPGTVLVGPHTFELVEPGFEWGAPVELRLKGKADEVIARQPHSARAPRDRRSAATSAGPLVGRGRELTALERARDGLLEGTGGVVIIRGEPGLGKTRLLAELRRRIAPLGSANEEPRWLEGRCVSYGEGLPYLPFRVLLRDWLGVTAERGDSKLADLLDQRISSLFRERCEEVRPFLATVLGLTARSSDVERLEGMQPDEVLLRVAAAFRGLLEQLTRNGPLVAALDDLQWSDPTSLELAEHLLPLVEQVPLLLVFATRPEQDHPVGQFCARAIEKHAERVDVLDLKALGHAADRELLSGLVAGAALPSDLENRILESAEGNPLYLEELVRSLLEAGAVVREGAGWRFEPRFRVEVPETIEKLILTRVDRLSPAARDLLCAASVLGRRFTRSLLEAIVDDTSALSELLAADLVRERHPGAEPEYRFKHHLIQEATYGSLLRRRRQELHRRVAEVVEAAIDGQGDERAGLLAYHWGAAGEHERALRFHRRAAEKASRIGAAHEAVGHYGAALASCAELGLGSEDERVRRMLVERGRMCLYAGRAEEGGNDIVEALRGARAADDRQGEMESLILLAWGRHGGPSHAIGLAEEAVQIARELEDDQARLRALTRLAILDAGQLRLDRALTDAGEALAVARSAGGEEALSWALDGLKLAELKLGHLAAVEKHCAELIRIHRQRGDDYFLQWALLESVYPLLGTGKLNDALGRAEEALALNRELSDRGDEPLFLDALCWVQRSRGDYGAALEGARRATAVAEGVNDEWYGWTAATLGWLLLDLRAAEEAVPVLESGYDAASRAEAMGERLRCIALLAWALWLHGERKNALVTADEAERMLGEMTVPAGSAWLFGAHAQLAVARTRIENGELERADAIARPLHDAASKTGWLEMGAAAAALLARCQEASGRVGEAVRLLEQAADAPCASSVRWEAQIELARLHAGDGEHHRASAQALLEQVLAGLEDDPAAGTCAAAFLPTRVTG